MSARSRTSVSAIGCGRGKTPTRASSPPRSSARGARIGRELGRLTPGAPNEAAFDSLITFTQAITDGDFESCARVAEDRTERIGAAADALIFEVRDYLRVI